MIPPRTRSFLDPSMWMSRVRAAISRLGQAHAQPGWRQIVTAADVAPTPDPEPSLLVKGVAHSIRTQPDWWSFELRQGRLACDRLDTKVTFCRQALDRVDPEYVHLYVGYGRSGQSMTAREQVLLAQVIDEVFVRPAHLKEEAQYQELLARQESRNKATLEELESLGRAAESATPSS